MTACSGGRVLLPMKTRVASPIRLKMHSRFQKLKFISPASLDKRVATHVNDRDIVVGRQLE